MLFTVKKENIIEGLQKAAGIIPTRAGAAYLRSLWIKAEGEVLTIMATDANIEFTGTYPADVKEPDVYKRQPVNFGEKGFPSRTARESSLRRPPCPSSSPLPKAGRTPSLSLIHI